MLTYESIIFPRKGGKIITGKELAISALDPTLRIGLEAAPLTSVSAMARRFAELALASSLSADFIILDGTLQPTYKGEENYISKLSSSTSALAKTSSLTTASGNSPVVLLNKIAGPGCWSYPVKDKTNFVKLHPDARHVFRFEGNADVLPHLPAHCQDALFLGYPYGLILADKLARISNEEKKSLRMNLLLRKENKEIAEYLNATNAHEILDAIG